MLNFLIEAFRIYSAVALVLGAVSYVGYAAWAHRKLDMPLTTVIGGGHAGAIMGKAWATIVGLGGLALAIYWTAWTFTGYGKVTAAVQATYVMMYIPWFYGVFTYKRPVELNVVDPGQ